MVPVVVSGPPAQSLIYSQDFADDLDKLVYEQGWILPGGQAEISIDSAADDTSGFLMIRSRIPDRQYVRVKVPVHPKGRYTVEYELQTEDVRPVTGSSGRGAVFFARFVDAEGDYVAGRIFPQGSSGTNDWRPRQFQMPEPAPDSAAYLDLLLGLEGSGEVRFRKIRVYGRNNVEFSHRYPVNGAEVTTRRPEFHWQADFSRYRLEVAADEDFNEPFYIYTAESGIRPLKALDAGRRYYWRILPWRPDRKGFSDSRPSSVFKFTVSPQASDWPPAVRSQAWQWATGRRRRFEVVVSPLHPDFSVYAWVNHVPAQKIRSEGNRVFFIPSQQLDSGVHNLRVEVQDRSGQRKVIEEGILNNVEPGIRTVIGDDGIMRVEGEPFFPIGAYRDPSDTLTDVAGTLEAEWNFVFSYYTAADINRTLRWLDLVYENDLLAMVRHNESWGYRTEERKFRLVDWVVRLSAHPALAAWYLFDEPELAGFTPLCSRRLKDIIRKADSNTVLTTVSHYLGSFGRMGDVFMPMSYVLGPYWHQPEDPLDARRMYDMGRHGQGIGTARERQPVSDGRIRPVWAILQAFDPHFREYRDDFEKTVERRGRPSQPTYTETRCMAFAALAYNVQGILFWYFGDNTYNLKTDAPEVWDGVVRTSRELRSLEDFLVRPETVADRLEVAEPLLVWTREAGGRRVLAVINPQVEPVEAELDLSKYRPLNARLIKPGEPTRNVGLRRGRLQLKFEAHEVKVFALTIP